MIEALVWNGWALSRIAVGSGVSTNVLRAVLNRGARTVAYETYERLKRFYNRSWNVQGGYKQSRERARREGYAPPAAWDDETIDDPKAEPDFGIPVELSHLDPFVVVQVDMLGEDRRAQLELLQVHGVSLEDAALCMRVTTSSVYLWMSKCGIHLATEAAIARSSREQVA